MKYKKIVHLLYQKQIEILNLREKKHEKIIEKLEKDGKIILNNLNYSKKKVFQMEKENSTKLILISSFKKDYESINEENLELRKILEENGLEKLIPRFYALKRKITSDFISEFEEENLSENNFPSNTNFNINFAEKAVDTKDLIEYKSQFVEANTFHFKTHQKTDTIDLIEKFNKETFTEINLIDKSTNTFLFIDENDKMSQTDFELKKNTSLNEELKNFTNLTETLKNKIRNLTEEIENIKKNSFVYEEKEREKLNFTVKEVKNDIFILKDQLNERNSRIDLCQSKVYKLILRFV